MFARFAFPPNLEGYCGPPETEEIYAYGAGLQAPDPGLEMLARSFDGAWPYLELLNSVADRDDPLSEEVVEAYWLGNYLLTRVRTGSWGNHLAGRFHSLGSFDLERITTAVGAGAVPNHAFHVFGVYPWIGLLRHGLGGSEPLRVLDRCRIRSGQVLDVDGDTARVRCRPLAWNGTGLSLGDSSVETFECGPAGGLAGTLFEGDAVALHWNWVCQRLSRSQVGWLNRTTRSQLGLFNKQPSDALG